MKLHQIETYDFASPTNIYSLYLLDSETLFMSTFSNVFTMKNMSRQKRYLTQIPGFCEILNIFFSSIQYCFHLLLS
jgi:hypothetical protein